VGRWSYSFLLSLYSIIPFRRNDSCSKLSFLDRDRDHDDYKQFAIRFCFGSGVLVHLRRLDPTPFDGTTWAPTAMMTTIDPFEIITVCLTILALYTGVIIWITSRLSSLTEKEILDIGALRIEMNTKVDAAKEAFVVSMESVKSDEGKRRHDLANQAQTAVFQLQSQLNALRDGGATKAELNAVENRLQTAISKVEASVEKLSVKLDIIPEMRLEMSALARLVREAIGVKA
jgi:DNA repair exonuclease SbcCD ATPase subunit